jgi:lambda family phage minor tail protein L
MTAPTLPPPDGGVDSEIQKFVPGPLVALYELDLSEIIDSGPTLHFTPDVHPDGAFLRWGTKVYVPVPIQAEGYDMDSRGAVPQPLIRVANVSGILLPILEETQHLRGATLTRYLLISDWLVDGADPHADWWIRRDQHRIEQMASMNPEWIEFRLTAAMDRGDEKTPGRQVVRDLCLWTYRVWDGAAWDYSRATCPYQGSAMFEADDSTTTNEGEDVCSKRLSGCRARYGTDPVPFGGFPGSGQRR